MSSTPSINAIFASGRSGSTWLGAIINSHPHIIYRFEPFHRLSKKEPTIKQYATLLKRASLPDYNLSDADIPQLYQSLATAHPLTDKPPFFPKVSIQVRGSNILQKSVWAVTRTVPFLEGIYQFLYTPRNLPPLVFKEVTFEQQMQNILKYTSIPVVYLVRHPCGNILSDISGQSKGKMPTDRQHILRDKLQKHYDPYLFDFYASQLDQLSPLERTALLWRLDIEKALKALQDNDRGFLITYEQLCDDAYTHIQPILKEFSLDFDQQIVDFLDKLYTSDSKGFTSSKVSRNKDWMNSFFTVYRNPKTQKSSWKKKIMSDDRKKIEAIVCNSWAFQHCAKLGQWD